MRKSLENQMHHFQVIQLYCGVNPINTPSCCSCICFENKCELVSKSMNILVFYYDFGTPISINVPNSCISTTAASICMQHIPLESGRSRSQSHKGASSPRRVRPTTTPSYLLQHIGLHQPVHSLRSSNSVLITVPSTKTATAARAFRISAPTVWNSLPCVVRETSSQPQCLRQI